MKTKTAAADYYLPHVCAALHPVSGEAIVIIRGQSGYRPLDNGSPATVERFNASLSIAPEEVESMLAGSMFGWSIPAARKYVPKTYN